MPNYRSVYQKTPSRLICSIIKLLFTELQIYKKIVYFKKNGMKGERIKN